MDFFSFISNIIASLSWPFTIVLLIFLLRKEIRALVPSLKKVKYKDFEMAFDKKAEELEKHAQKINLPEAENILLPTLSMSETIDELVKVSPRLAVIESFAWLESAIRDASVKHNISRDKFFGVRNGFKELVKRKIIPENFVPLFNEFRILRNELSHNIEENISIDSARIYAENALSMVNLIKKS